MKTGRSFSSCWSSCTTSQPNPCTTKWTPQIWRFASLHQFSTLASAAPKLLPRGARKLLVCRMRKIYLTIKRPTSAWRSWLRTMRRFLTSRAIRTWSAISRLWMNRDQWRWIHWARDSRCKIGLDTYMSALKLPLKKAGKGQKRIKKF